ncbi:AAA family ATPase [Lactococcus formosensis]|uniref:ATP-binding protein n=1 Tax=Lactococcus formosensis TaxID=1281486 RepID=A0A9Q9D6P5_9LACT|nr:AAA family ATPase [Lactococcus formosensis]USJ20197.1 ATP-binding protein [Lactococcus formosensis]
MVVELSPFMIFGGENGIGKTQLMKLLKSMEQFLIEDVQRYLASTETSRVFSKYSSIVPQEIDVEKTIDITKGTLFYKRVLELANIHLNNNMDNIIKRTFGEGDEIKTFFNIGHVEIIYSSLPKVEIKVLRENPDLSNNDDTNKYIYKISSDIIGGESRHKREWTYTPGSPYEATPLGKRIVSTLIADLLFQEVLAYNKGLRNDEFIYFPASRETYLRDSNIFFKKDIDNLSDINISKSSDGKRFSNDPFIEKYVLKLQENTWNPEKKAISETLSYFFEENFLKMNIEKGEGRIIYKDNNSQIINPMLASSAINEYSSILYLMRTQKEAFDILLEEPESHLSVNNIFKFTQILLTLVEKGYPVWLTTHDSIVIDTINYVCKFSQLKLEDRREIQEKYSLIEDLVNVKFDFLGNLQAYHVREDSITKMPKDDGGIVYEALQNDINNFSNFMYEVEEKSGSFK